MRSVSTEKQRGALLVFSTVSGKPKGLYYHYADAVTTNEHPGAINLQDFDQNTPSQRKIQ